MKIASFEILREVSWEIMKVVDQAEGDWGKLRTYDGTIGFVHGDYVRSSIDYRFGFEANAEGEYKMTFFIAGD